MRMLTAKGKVHPRIQYDLWAQSSFIRANAHPFGKNDVWLLKHRQSAAGIYHPVTFQAALAVIGLKEALMQRRKFMHVSFLENPERRFRKAS